MTSPARASTRISLKPRSAAKQALVALMWRRTPARLRNSPRLDRWPVSVQLTQTKRVTPQWIVGAGAPGPAAGPALDAITATSNRLRMTRMPVIALRASLLAEKHAQLMCPLHGAFELGQPVYKRRQNCTAGHVLASCNKYACGASRAREAESISKGRGNGFCK